MPKERTARHRPRGAGPERAVRVHAGLTLLEVARPGDLDDLRAVPEVQAAWVRRLGPRRVVLDGSRLPALLAALERHGALPRVVPSGADEEG